MLKLNRFYRYIVPYWKIETLALVLSWLSMALGLASPYLAKLIIDKAYPDKDLRLFVILISGIGIIFIIGGLFKGFSSYLARYARFRVNLDINRDVFRKIQNLPYRFFQDTSTGENLYKINYDIEQVTQLTADLLPQIAVLIPKSIFILGIILYVSPKMFIFVLALIPFLYIIPWYFTKKLKKSWKILVENSQGIFKRLQETLSHMYLIKSCGMEKRETRSYMQRVFDNIRLRIANTRLEVTASFFNTAAQKAILGLIIFYGGYQVIKGRMTLGSLGAISIYIGQLSGVQASFANFIQQVSSGLVSVERLENVLKISSGPIKSPELAETEFYTGGIEFNNVTFGYNGGKMVLDNMSFSINGGSHVAITGPSGSGKTTMVNLLLMLYRPLSGNIYIDGLDVNGIEPECLYSQTGIALQEPYLWNDTVENNIRYGRPDADFKDIEEAARIACADEFIKNLPDGYKTIIGENASKVSEGQKQRIAIARAVIKRPKILILDEATSSVGEELEQKVIENIRNAFKKSTIIVISHNASLAQKMDVIYFISSPGRIRLTRRLDGYRGT